MRTCTRLLAGLMVIASAFYAFLFIYLGLYPGYATKYSPKSDFATDLIGQCGPSSIFVLFVIGIAIFIVPLYKANKKRGMP